MDLSIIIPVYNTDIETFSECLNSLNISKEIKYEVLIVDDGSDVKKSNLYKNWLDKKNCFKYYYKKNGGVSSARNYGLEKAIGKYIMFVDSDDCCYGNKITKNLLMKNYNIIFFNKTYSYNNVKYERQEIHSNTGEINCQDILYDFIINNRFYSPVAKIIEKDFLAHNKIKFNESLIQGEDAIFNLDMLIHLPKIYYINGSIYEYRYSFDTSLNRWKKFPNKMLSNFLYLYEKKVQAINSYLIDYKEHCIKKMEENAINYLFQNCLAIVDSCTKKESKFYLTEFKKITNQIIKEKRTLKIIVKIKILFITRLNNYYLLEIIAKIRKIYLKYFKKNWNQ